MGAFRHKIHRYKSLISNFRNWPQFLVFKTKGGNAFRFKMRSGFEIEVPKKMLPPFKESFFDGVYMQGFPPHKIPEGGALNIIDIGANVGYFSLFMFSRYPKASLYSYEPMPFNYGQLKKYQDHYQQFDWHTEQRAVADHRDGITLFSSTLDGFSTMASVFEEDRKGEQIAVETLTLSDVLDKYQLDRVNLIKLDCEGSEYAILYNCAEETLAKLELISIETHPGDSENKNHEGMITFLKKQGFTLSEQRNSDGTGYIWAWRA
jgi:FkbM family methyltransferase